MWTQLDFQHNTMSRNAATNKAPLRAYVEAREWDAQVYAQSRGWSKAPDISSVSFDTLEKVCFWLHANEYKRASQGIDVWIADELAAGCVFVPADEVARVLAKESR